MSEMLKEKVSYDDMKRYVTLNGNAGVDSANATAKSGAGSAGGGGPLANRQFELIDEEIRRLKDKFEDTFHQVQSLK